MDILRNMKGDSVDFFHTMSTGSPQKVHRKYEDGIGLI
jgi:hypothetical protein